MPCGSWREAAITFHRAATAKLPIGCAGLSPGWAGFWGEGLTKAPAPRVNESVFAWARENPAELRSAAKAIAARRPLDDNPAALRLKRVLDHLERPANVPEQLLSPEQLLRFRPQALVEAVEILIARPEAVRTVLLRSPYTDPESIGGYLDRAL